MAGEQHYLVSPTKVLPLPMDRGFYIGRSAGNQVVLNDTRVSRRHAEIFWDGEQMVLNDLGSNNGTFVNGKAVTSLILTDGMKIEVGSHAYIYRHVNRQQDLRSSTTRLQKIASMNDTSHERDIVSDLPECDFNGVLGATSLVEICQMLHTGLREGQLTVQAPEKEKAVMIFERGEIKAAVYDPLEGDDAVIEMLHITKGHFSFRNGTFSSPAAVTKNTSFLILESMRLDDEHETVG